MSKLMEERESFELKNVKTICLLVSLYIVISLVSNISSLRIILIFALSMDAGTILYPLTFTLRDMIHKKAGKTIAIFTILAAAGLNVFMFLMFYLVAQLPADMTVGPQQEFGTLLLPGIRIVAGSILAMIVAELLDTVIYSAVIRKLGSKLQWARVVLSNAVSVPLDSIVFSFVAFYGVLPLEVVFATVLSNILIKYFVTAWSVGSIYLVKEDKN